MQEDFFDRVMNSNPKSKIVLGGILSLFSTPSIHQNKALAASIRAQVEQFLRLRPG
jgi:hypothetical protein